MLTALFPSQLGSLASLSQQMDRLFESTMPWQGSWQTTWPALNVWRDNASIFAEAEVPGFSMDQIEVFATEDTLTIRAQRQPSAPENATALRTERTVTQFERTLQVPLQIDPDGVEAKLAAGVLTITMPIAENAKPRQIQVTEASKK